MRILIPLLLVFSAQAVEISEKMLVELAKKDVPGIEEIESRMLQSKLNYQQILDNKTGASAYGGYNHTSTKERAIIPFIPIYSPINQYKAGLVKPTRYGVSADVSASVDQRSGKSAQNSFKDIHTTIYALTFNIDLWKDLFGSLTRKEIENAKLSFESAKIQKEIEGKTFELAVRRLYWAIVANNEKLKISKRLYEQSKTQLSDALKRAKASIADAGEVARYKAQAAQRKGTMLFYEYERENLGKQLKDLIPHLQIGSVELAPYDLDKTLGDVLQCAAVIQVQKEPPMGYTKYDEVTKLLRRVQTNQLSIDSKYDDVDLSLSTTFKTTGLGSSSPDSTNYEGSYSDSIDDLNDNDRSGFEAGLMLTIPIGKKLNGAEETKKAYNKKRLSAEIRNANSNIITTHKQIKESVKLLSQVIEAQKINNKELAVRVREINKQYRQARVSLNTVIQDQDSLANSELSIVDTQLQVLYTLFDYFAVFTETPCGFNRI